MDSTHGISNRSTMAREGNEALAASAGRKRKNAKKNKATETLFLLELLLVAYALIQFRAFFVHSDIAFNEIMDYAASSISIRRLSSTTKFLPVEAPSQSSSDDILQENQSPANSLFPIQSSPIMAWKHMMLDWNMHSIAELGACGTATPWFAKHNATAICVTPSNPRSEEWSTEWQITHDLAQQGPWKPSDTFDAVWATDLLEQIPLNQASIYQTTLRSTAAVMVVKIPKSFVEQVWLDSMEDAGFRYHANLTSQLRQWVKEKDPKTPGASGSWLAQSLVVLLNPMVASLPEHAHLFMEHGCYAGRILAKDREPDGPAFRRRECGEGNSPGRESPLPQDFRPKSLNPEMDAEWQSFMLKQVDALSIPLEYVQHQQAQSQKHKHTFASNLRFGRQPYPEPVEPFEGFWDLIKSRAKNESLVPGIMHRIKQKNFTNMPPVSALVFPQYKAGLKTAEHKHLGKNGVDESWYLNSITDDRDFSDENLIWIADTGWGWSWERWCANFTNAVKTAIVHRYDAGVNTRWPIFIVDFSDGAGRQRCLDVETLVGIDLVSYSARSIAKNRGWIEKKEWIQFGNKVRRPENYSYLRQIPDEKKGEKHYRHTPLPVRTDTVHEFRSVLKANHNVGLRYPIELLPRPIDVTHLWPLSNSSGVEHGVVQRLGHFRNRVSRLVHEYGQELGWETSIEVKGRGISAGRHGVHVDYIEGLLETKILVVTQRDAWEDHYRLQEGLLSGALVISDFMHGLPEGLVNGTSILMFKTPGELKSIISYYLEHGEERLAVAQRGREVALSRHRTWHRMEEIVFGEILTTCDPSEKSECPYIVHSHEII